MGSWWRRFAAISIRIPMSRSRWKTLGRALGVSPFHLQRTFKARTGITPRAYVRFPPFELAQSRAARGTLGYALAL